MTSLTRRRPANLLARLGHAITRLLAIALRVAIVGFSMGLAAPSFVTKPLRHDDAVVQVVEEELP